MGGKSKAPKPPNYQPVADASRDAAQYAADAANDQLDFAKQQYADMRPIFDRIVESQLSTQDETQAQGRDYFDYMKSTFRPVEQGLVRDAEAFNTGGYQEKLATQAAADVGRAFSQTEAMSDRAMASMGVNPNSAKFASAKKASALGLAAKRADAMTDTRDRAEQMGWAKRMDVTGLGRNLPGASTASYGVALQAGSNAGGSAMSPGTQYMAGMGQAAGTMQRGQAMQMQGLTGILDAQGSIYRADQANSAAASAGLGSMLGTVGGAVLGGPMGGWIGSKMFS